MSSIARTVSFNIYPLSIANNAPSMSQSLTVCDPAMSAMGLATVAAFDDPFALMILAREK